MCSCKLQDDAGDSYFFCPLCFVRGATSYRVGSVLGGSGVPGPVPGTERVGRGGKDGRKMRWMKDVVLIVGMTAETPCS